MGIDFVAWWLLTTIMDFTLSESFSIVYFYISQQATLIFAQMLAHFVSYQSTIAYAFETLAESVNKKIIPEAEGLKEQLTRLRVLLQEVKQSVKVLNDSLSIVVISD